MTVENKFMVGSRADGRIVVQRVPGQIWPLELSRADALNVAAWIVVLADPLGEDFQALRSEIESGS